MFGSKDINGLFEAQAMSRNPFCPLWIQRMNPEVNEDQLDMADADLMDDWEKIGKEYAEEHVVRKEGKKK